MNVQTVRLIDVFFIGPAMILAASYPMPAALKWSMAGLGIATIVYNAYNYTRHES